MLGSTRTSICLCAWLLLLVFPSVVSKAHLWIRFKRFDNPGGKGDNGQCCDGRIFICPSKCDHRFVVCIDRVYGRLDTSSCPYGKKVTSEILDQDSIIFQDFIGNEKNPMIFDFNSWPGRVKVKIGVWDKDDNSDDLVDFLNTDVSASPAASMTSAQVQRIVVKNRVTLYVDVMVFCGPNSFGQTCSTVCAAQNDASAGYKCNVRTGAKICLDGWMSEGCDVSVDDCLTNRCQHEARCVDAHLGYSCICSSGYIGDTCEIDIDECVSSPCKNGGTCGDMEGAFNCMCAPGWTGGVCEVDADECAGGPCVHGTCKDLVNEFECTCNQGYTGKTCDTDIDECLNQPCVNAGTCINQEPGFQCACAPGFAGGKCENDVDECLDSPCFANSSCINTYGSYQCICQPDFTGQNCSTRIDNCIGQTCKNNGTCIDDVNDFLCACIEDWTGRTCSDYVNRCTRPVCKNGATCNDPGPGEKLQCQCAKGWTGDVCEQDYDECQSDPCSNGATCSDSLSYFSCQCLDGWTGPTCDEDIDECLLLAREEERHNGELTMNGTQDFTHNGDHNAHHMNDTESADGFQSVYNDSMLACHHAGFCVNVDGGYMCQCLPGWEGDRCQTDKDECRSNPCQNSGLCRNTIGNFTCTCPDSWTGELCEKDVDECARSPCVPPIPCENHPGGYTCLCPVGWQGVACDEDINECLGETTNASCGGDKRACNSSLVFPCHNSGTCLNTPGSFQCTCTAGWTGERCEQDVDECSPPVVQETTSVTKGTTSIFTETPTVTDDVNPVPLEMAPAATVTTSVVKKTSFVVTTTGTVTLKWSEVSGARAHTEKTKRSSDFTQSCQHEAACKNTPGSFYCECPPQWRGDLCQDDVDECTSNPCKNGGTCTNMQGGFECTCAIPWEGPSCSLERDECLYQPCDNNGTCIARLAADGGGVQCLCQRGWRGPSCQNDRDECEQNACLNNGTCTNLMGGFQCACPDGIIGVTCSNDTALDNGVTLPLYMEGWLKTQKRAEVQEGIKRFLMHYGDFRHDVKIRAEVQTLELTLKDVSKDLTQVSIQLMIDNVTLSKGEVTEIFNRVPPYQLQNYLPQPLYFGGVESEDVVVRASSQAVTLSIPWYFILAGALVLVLLVTALVILYNVRETMSWWPGSKRSDTAMMFKNGARNPAYNVDVDDSEPPMQMDGDNNALVSGHPSHLRASSTQPHSSWGGARPRSGDGSSSSGSRPQSMDISWQSKPRPRSEEILGPRVRPPEPLPCQRSRPMSVAPEEAARGRVAQEWGYDNALYLGGPPPPLQPRLSKMHLPPDPNRGALPPPPIETPAPEPNTSHA